MPVCEGCGGSFDENFKFCPYCGRAKPEPKIIKIQVDVNTTDKWETCRVQRQILKNNQYITLGHFWADGIGEKGKFRAGESFVFRIHPNGDSDERKAQIFLINHLAENGWEAYEAGEKWWDNRLRRKINPSNPMPWETWEINLIMKQSWSRATCWFSAHRATGVDQHIFTIYGESEKWKGGALATDIRLEKREQYGIHQCFCASLVQEGFIETGSVGENWFNTHLIRRIKTKSNT